MKVGEAGQVRPFSTDSELESCLRYDRLVAEIAHRRATEEEAAELLEHERSCAGPHSVVALEAELGLEPGALCDGSDDYGVRSAAEVIARIRARL